MRRLASQFTPTTGVGTRNAGGSARLSSDTPTAGLRYRPASPKRGFDCVRDLNHTIRSEHILCRTKFEMGMRLRTILEHLGPIGTAGSTKHLHAVLLLGHAVVGKLGVDVGGHVVVNFLTVISLVEAASASVATHGGTSHAPPVAVLVINPIDAARSRQLILVVAHVVHAIGGGDETKRVDHAIGSHVAHTVHVVHITTLTHGLCLGLRILLHVGLGMRQMAGASGVAATNGALDEMALQDITSREGITAQDTHIRAVAGICSTCQNANPANDQKRRPWRWDELTAE